MLHIDNKPMFCIFIAISFNILIVLYSKVSKGLWKQFGDKRVKDTPITEVCAF